MRLYLNKDKCFVNIPVEQYGRRPGGGSFQRVCRIQLGKPSVLARCSDKDEEEDWDGGAKRFCDKLEDASSKYQLEKGDNSYHLCVHVIAGGGEYYTRVRVHGFLCDMMLQELRDEKVKLELQIGLHVQEKQTQRLVYSKLLFAEVPISPKEALGPPYDVDDAACIRNEKYFEVKLKERNLFLLYDPGRTNVGGSINVILSREELPMTGSSDSPERREIYRKIVDNRIHTDVLIVASNGVELACNKSILAANSPVFAAMFATAMMTEAETNTIEIDDMSEEAVRAFLAYLYAWDLKAPLENPMMAMELLKAGHKYDIPHLEKDMKKIFDRKPASWFGVEVALELFLFVRKLDGCDELKVAAFDILQMKVANMTIGSLKELIRDKDQFQGLDIDLLFDVLQISRLKEGNSRKAN